MEQTIFHVDMDAFFASIEIKENPKLKGKAVIVGGHPDKRGVVSTCSYEARKFGVRSAMSLFEAKKRCPHAIFLEGNYHLYQKYSNEVMEILLSFSPVTEIVGIDEAYMDFTGAHSPFKIGQLIRKAVAQKTGLTCSIGIGSSKLIAKISSSFAKPNGLFEVPFGKEVEFLRPLPVETLPGVGKKSQIVLNLEGIKSVGDLQDLGMEKLIQSYGAYGYYLYRASLGKDDRKVEIEEDSPKSIGAENTFEVDQSGLKSLQTELKLVFNKAYKRFRKHKCRTRGFSLKLRTHDFKTITRSHTFSNHINDYETLLTTSQNLLANTYQADTFYRLIGISFEKLTFTYWQPTFWD